MGRGNIAKWPVHFVKGAHNWQNITREDDDGYMRSVCVKCLDCSLKANQDSGSLAYFVVENDAELAILSCEEVQILDIIK
jgi:hypothetical protein